MSLEELDCEKKYRKYSDTVAVSAAIYDLFKKNQSLGRFVGESHRLSSPTGEEFTPDMSTVYDSSGLVFEIKYSLGASVKDELLSLKKYSSATQGWPTRIIRTGIVQSVDVVLVCNAEDTSRVSSALSEVAKETGDSFFSSGLAVWQWIISSTKDRNEAMWLQHVTGATRNNAVEACIHSPGGIQVSEEVLDYLRWQHLFIRDKPPVQYTIMCLLHYVLPREPDKEKYAINLDIVYQRANSFFPGWWEETEKTTQLKRKWVKEALDTLVRMRLIEVDPANKESYIIPSAVFRKKRPLKLICRKLVGMERRQPRGRPPRRHRIIQGKPERMRPLNDFLR